MSNPALLDVILARSTGKGSRIHGPTHWAGVAAAGLTLLDSTPEADPLVVLLFAMFHDSMRQSDGHDPEHGKRGAELARQMRDASEFDLDDARLETLGRACEFHDKGQTSTDPTIGACWDADRLNLWRVGRRPDPALLATPVARRVASNVASKAYGALAFDWRALFAEYGAKRDPRSVYLRFGDLPEGGRSAIFLGFQECGVSVYPGSEQADGSYALDLHRLVLGIDTRFLASVLRQARPLYLVEGRQVGIGGMGEPVLEDARIVWEVPADLVDVLPDRPRFRALVEAWRAMRKGEHHDPYVWLGAKEPDERRVFPLVANGQIAGFWDTVESQKREMLKGWGLLEDYDKVQAGDRARRERAKPAHNPYALESFNNTSWKESSWN